MGCKFGHVTPLIEGPQNPLGPPSGTGWLSGPSSCGLRHNATRKEPMLLRGTVCDRNCSFRRCADMIGTSRGSEGEGGGGSRNVPLRDMLRVGVAFLA